MSSDAPLGIAHARRLRQELLVSQTTQAARLMLAGDDKRWRTVAQWLLSVQMSSDIYEQNHAERVASAFLDQQQEGN